MPVKLVNLREWVWPIAPVALVYTACFLGGANEAFPALVLSAAAALLLFIYLLSPQINDDLGRLRKVTPAAAAFALTLLVAAWSLTPWIPGGQHPVWAFVPALGASTIDRSRTLIEIFKLLGMAAVLVLAALSSGHGGGRRLHISVLIFGAAFVFWAIWQLAQPGHQGGLRLTGGLPSPNVAGTLIAALAILSFPLIGRRSSSEAPARVSAVERGLSAYAPGIALLLLFSAALLLTASRGAMISAGVASVVYLGLQTAAGRLKLRQGVLWGLCLFLAGLGLLFAKGDLAVERFGQAAVDAHGRLPLFILHWDAFLRSPLFGYGLGSFDGINKLSLSGELYPSLWTVRAAHSVFLQWLEEAGILGAIPMFACVGLIILSATLPPHRRRRGQSWRHALVAVDVLFLVHGASDFALQVSGLATFWALLLGLQIATASSAG